VAGNNATQSNQIQGLAPVDYLHKKKMQAEQFQFGAKILIKTSRWNLALQDVFNLFAGYSGLFLNKAFSLNLSGYNG
jgi:hypothetical protein